MDLFRSGLSEFLSACLSYVDLGQSTMEASTARAGEVVDSPRKRGAPFTALRNVDAISDNMPGQPKSQSVQKEHVTHVISMQSEEGLTEDKQVGAKRTRTYDAEDERESKIVRYETDLDLDIGLDDFGCRSALICSSTCLSRRQEMVKKYSSSHGVKLRSQHPLTSLRRSKHEQSQQQALGEEEIREMFAQRKKAKDEERMMRFLALEQCTNTETQGSFMNVERLRNVAAVSSSHVGITSHTEPRREASNDDRSIVTPVPFIV